MKSTSMKRYSSLIAADFSYCPVTTPPRMTRSASSRDAKLAEHEHSSGDGVRSAGGDGDKSTMTVLIGVRETMNESAMADLLQSLRAYSGISSARQSRANHLLFIEYDPSMARRRDILAHLGDRGLHACVAGC